MPVDYQADYNVAMDRRIFIGIPVSNDLRERVLVWEKKYQEPNNKFQTNFKTPTSNPKLRWVKGKNLHITLVPPWEEQKWQAAKDKLKAVKFKPFEINFNKIAYGPNSREPAPPKTARRGGPRMIWATGSASPQILQLKQSLEKALATKIRGREFYQHMTLARFANGLGAVVALVANPEGEIAKVDWRMKVEKFVLYESRLSPQGSDYEALAEFML